MREQAVLVSDNSRKILHQRRQEPGLSRSQSFLHRNYYAKRPSDVASAAQLNSTVSANRWQAVGADATRSRAARNQSHGTFEDLDCMSSSAGYSASDLQFNRSMATSSRYGPDGNRMFSPQINPVSQRLSKAAGRGDRSSSYNTFEALHDQARLKRQQQDEVQARRQQ